MATTPAFENIEPSGSAQFILHSARRSLLRRMALVALSGPFAPSLSVGSEMCGNTSGASVGRGDMWVVNTRAISSSVCRADLDAPRLHVSRLEDTAQFSGCAIEQLLEDVRKRPDVPTVIYAHGNRFTHQAAIERAWLVYRKILAHQREQNCLRFVLWSWPSEQIGLALKDVRIKAQRTDAQGLYLAWFLRQLNSTNKSGTNPPITLIGYSFGGRVVTGALHALAGGPLAGHSLPGETIVGTKANVGLIAAAIEETWLIPGAYHGRATKNIERLSLMYNPRDKVLKRYWLLECDEFVRALGVVGRLRLGPKADGTPVDVKTYNCSSTVGQQHDELDYFSYECRGGAILARLIQSGVLSVKQGAMSSRRAETSDSTP